MLPAVPPDPTAPGDRVRPSVVGGGDGAGHGDVGSGCGEITEVPPGATSYRRPREGICNNMALRAFYISR